MIQVRFHDTNSDSAVAGLFIPVILYFIVMLIMFTLFGDDTTHHPHRFESGGWKLLVIWLGPYCFSALLWFLWSLSQVMTIERG